MVNILYPDEVEGVLKSISPAAPSFSRKFF
jgi:hypothetical protein